MRAGPARGCGTLRSRGFFFFFQAEDGIRDLTVTGVQTCALPISAPYPKPRIVGTLLRSRPSRGDRPETRVSKTWRDGDDSDETAARDAARGVRDLRDRKSVV